MIGMRLLFRLAVVAALASAPPPVWSQLTDAQILRDQIRDLQAKRAEEVAAWRRDRAALIKGYTDRGATEAEAAAAVDSLIAHGEAQVRDGATVLSATTPEIAALNQKVTILNGISRLNHQRFKEFVSSQGMEMPTEFLGCLCATYSISGAGISYHPEPAGDCQNAMPCKGGNWGCVSYDLPTDPRAWTACAGYLQAGGRPLTDQLIDKVRAMQTRYDRDVCAQLRSVLDVTKDLLKQGKLKPNGQSFLATHDLEKSFADFLTGMDITGVTEVAAGALMDKLAESVKQNTGFDIFAADGPTGLGYLLTVGEPPSETGNSNLFVRVTKVLAHEETIRSDGVHVPMSYEMRLARRILQSGGNLNPGDVFRMAAEVTGGDVPLAALVAHNLLKEAAYAGREGKPMVIGTSPYSLQGSADPATQAYLKQVKEAYSGAFDGKATFAGDSFILQPGLITGKLQDIRPLYDPHVSDRLGPWYHSFGVIFVGSNPMLGESTAYVTAATENLTRILGLGSERSLGKEAANRCAAVLVSLMNRNIEARAP